MAESSEHSVRPRPPRKRRWLRAVLFVVAAWLLLAYVVLPALWRHHEHNPALADVPMVTRDAEGIPGDPLNVGFVGTEAEVEGALRLAGWTRAVSLSVASDLKIAESVVLDRPDQDAPVSSLYLFGRRQDFAFEMEVGKSANERHHVRLWRTELGSARPVWVGSASFDRTSGLSKTTGEITHHIAPDIDAERDHLFDDLVRAGQIATLYQVTGVGPTLDGRNAEGDRYFTNGELTVGVLTVDNAVNKEPPQRLESPWATRTKDQIWSLLRPVID